MVHLLEEVVRVSDPEAVEHCGHVLSLVLVHEAGVGEPGREGVVEVGRADVQILATVAQPELGPIFHRAVAAFLLTFVEMGEKFGEVVGKLGGFGHLRRKVAGKKKEIDGLPRREATSMSLRNN